MKKRNSLLKRHKGRLSQKKTTVGSSYLVNLRIPSSLRVRNCSNLLTESESLMRRSALYVSSRLRHAL